MKCSLVLLYAGNFIVKAEWLPGQSSGLAIITADFIKIYSLHSDVISPSYYYLLPAGKVTILLVFFIGLNINIGVCSFLKTVNYFYVVGSFFLCSFLFR